MKGYSDCSSTNTYSYCAGNRSVRPKKKCLVSGNIKFFGGSVGRRNFFFVNFFLKSCTTSGRFIGNIMFIMFMLTIIVQLCLFYKMVLKE